MRRTALISTVIGIFVLIGSAQAAAPRCTYGQRADDSCWADLSGWWTTDEGQLWFQQDGNDFYALRPPTCAAGRERQRDWYIAGRVESTADGFKIFGTMWRCTDGKLVQECGHAGSYKIPFTGTADFGESVFGGGTYKSITLEYAMEYWKIPQCVKDNEAPQSESVFRWIGDELPKPEAKDSDHSDYWKKQYQLLKRSEHEGVDRFFRRDERPLVDPH